MGNCFSSQESTADALKNLVQRPGDPEITLTADTINQGLQEVAQILQRSRRNITIVAIGGAVNTLYLRSRSQTSDVDFFYRTKLRNEDVTAIIQAAQRAAQAIQVGEGWLNNHTAVFITYGHANMTSSQEGMIGSLYEEATTQNVVIFEAPGLRVLAAPWRYALATKIDRLGKGAGARDKDLGDAVVYLRQVTQQLGRAVRQEEFIDWYAEFGLGEPSNDVLVQLENEYFARYGESGIVLPG